jgi:L-seryl-tRNA(Ser) seleniumtransferase
MGIGRGMKVGKEEIVGLLAAVERYVTLDHAAEWRTWESRTAEMIELLAPIPGISTRRDVPDIANHSPHVVIQWSQMHCALTALEVVRRLRAGDPPIAVLREGERSLRVAVWTLRGEEHRIVCAQFEQVIKGIRS